jgi:transcriptional regulator with GAF, ATPase, and Fis domain
MFDFRYLAQPSTHTPSRTHAAPALLTDNELRTLERNNLIAVLKQTRWKVSGKGGAAEFLGINPATLASRLRTLKISRSQSEQNG